MTEIHVKARAGSPVAAAGLGALGPDGPEPPVEPPPDEEPTPVDWAALAALVAEASADVVTAHMAADRAVRTLQTVAQRIEEYADAA